MPDLPHEKGSRANKAPPLCCIRQSIFSMRDRFSDAAPLLRVTYENRRGRETSRRSEEHTSALQSLMRISYAVFCSNKKSTPSRQRTRSDEHPHDHHTPLHNT